MEDDLRRLNIEMAEEETKGNRAFFDRLLAPAFAFRRANGNFDDRQVFLNDLKPGARRECDSSSIRITHVAEKRAFVTCVVRMQVDNDWKEFHNARLFVRDGERWRLLAWANEPVAR